MRDMTTTTISTQTVTLTGAVHGPGTVAIDADAALLAKGSIATAMTFLAASGTLAKLHFAGSYTTASFASAPDGHGGTFITHT